MVHLQPVFEIHVLPVFVGRQDIENGEPRQAVGMIEAHAIGDTRPAIMTGEREDLMAEPRHHRDDIVAHGALGVGLPAFGLRHGALPVTAQIRDDQSEIAVQFRRQLMPHDPAFGIAVQQHQRRPIPADAHVQRGAIAFHLAGFEIRKELWKISH